MTKILSIDGTLIGLSALLPGIRSDAPFLLSKIPRSKIRDYLIFLLNYNLDGRRDGLCKTLIKDYFGCEKSDFFKILMSGLTHLRALNSRAILINNRYSCLTVYEYIEANTQEFDLPSDYNEEMEKFNVLLCVLAKNDELNITSKRSYEAVKLLPDPEDKIKYYIALNIAQHDLMNFSPIESICQSVKLSYLLKFLRESENYKTHFNELLIRIGCESSDVFLIRFLEILNLSLSGNEENWFVITLSQVQPKQFEFITKFVTIESFEQSSYDFTKLKEYPINRRSENEFQIIFIKFYIDKFYRAMYFLLNDINDNLPADFQLKNFRRAYTTDFTEIFLSTDILRLITKNFDVQLSESEIVDILKNTGQFRKGSSPSLPDFYGRDDKKIFLFELKDTLLGGNIKTSMEIADVESFLRTRFNHQTIDKKGQKGIPQLIGYLSDMISGKIQYEAIADVESHSFYCVLLLTDEIYNTIGINGLLNHWFQIQVDELVTSLNIDRKIIRPLCILTLDTLIFYYYYFDTNMVSLAKIIDMYVSDCQASDQTIEDNHPFSNQYLPFSSYLKNYLLESGTFDAEKLFSYSFDNLVKFEHPESDVPFPMDIA